MKTHTLPSADGNEVRRFAIIYAIALVVLLALTWGITAKFLSEEKSRAFNSATVEGNRLVTFFEGNVSNIFRYADDYIKTVRRIYLQTQSLAAVRSYMSSVPPDQNILSHITIIDRNGVPVFLSDGRVERKFRPGVNARDRGYFKSQKASKTDSLVISNARKGRNTGIVTIRVVRRLTGEGAAFEGIIFAAVKAEQLRAFFMATRPGPRSTATLVGTDKIVRWRLSQDALTGVGKSISVLKLWENLQNSPSGQYQQTSIIDGFPRKWAYKKVAGFPVVAVIGTALPDIIAGYERFQRHVYVSAGLVSLVFIVLTVLALREKFSSIRLTRSLTQQARVEEELRASREQSQMLTDMSPDAVFVQIDGKVVFVNPAMIELMGANSADDLIGMSSFDIAHPDMRPRLINLRDGITQKGIRIEPRELRYLNLKGETFDVESAAAPIKWEGKGGIMIVARNITDRKLLEEKLSQAQKMEAIGQLTGGVAHDFNNLLAVIMGNAELLAEDNEGEEQKAQSIIRAAQRGANLTQRLLAYSRQQPLQPKALDPETLVTGMSELLARTLGETITVNSVVPADISNVLVDQGQVESALLNLAVNARDAMPNGGTLSIECENISLDAKSAEIGLELPEGQYIKISVTDSGTGMSARVIEHAFDPFFTTKEVGQGSGLGLSMVYGFAKQSGGHVTIHSEEGHGTTVGLYLPAVDRVVPVVTPSIEDDLPIGQEESVLLLEDDPDVRALAVDILTSLNYLVLEAENADAAMQILTDGNKVELVLSDVVLPGGKSGPDFATEAMEHSPHLKFIFMSGYSAEVLENNLVSKDTILLNKPFKRAQLARALRKVLD
jgi:PAS domain S-box-containing protein